MFNSIKHLFVKPMTMEAAMAKTLQELNSDTSEIDALIAASFAAATKHQPNTDYKSFALGLIGGVIAGRAASITTH